MLIYHYADNGEYLGQSAAMESPMETGVFLIPRNATEAAPPEPETGFARVFDGADWHQVIDRRGTTYWTSHTESFTICDLGVDIPNGASIDRPEAPPAPPLGPTTAIKAWQGVLWLGKHGTWRP